MFWWFHGMSTQHESCAREGVKKKKNQLSATTASHTRSCHVAAIFIHGTRVAAWPCHVDEMLRVYADAVWVQSLGGENQPEIARS